MMLIAMVKIQNPIGTVHLVGAADASVYCVLLCYYSNVNAGFLSLIFVANDRTSGLIDGCVSKVACIYLFILAFCILV